MSWLLPICEFHIEFYIELKQTLTADYVVYNPQSVSARVLCTTYTVKLWTNRTFRGFVKIFLAYLFLLSHMGRYFPEVAKISLNILNIEKA